MDAPSAQLRSLLSDLKLADDRQFRRCRSTVRALVRDLPAFDSVWIDALVQCRALTLFQAELIADGRGRELEVGSYVLVEPLQRDERLTTFRARQKGTGKIVQLTRVGIDGDDLEAVAERLDRLVQTCAQLTETRSRQLLAFPHEVLRLSDVWLISPLVEGLSCAALLVRRGRFPTDVVESIAVQLLSSLAAAEKEGLCHGDLHAQNVLLTRNGQVAFRNWGILSAVMPVVTVHSRAPLESLSVLAPERICQPRGPTATSDLYAVGCLFWQLLAGRAPFLTADPLVLRTAHVQRRISDVREVAPATSSRLADLINRMTERDPERRLQLFAEAESELREGKRGPKTRVARFVTSFESAAPRSFGPEKSAGAATRSVVTAILLALATAGGTFAYRQRSLITEGLVPNTSVSRPANQPSPMITPSRTFPGVVTASYEVVQRGDQNTEPRPLPPPTASGTIELTGGRRYLAGVLNHPGPLTIRAASDPSRPAIIEVGKEPLVVRADTVHLDGIALKPSTTGPWEGECLARIVAQELTLVNCRFLGGAPADGTNPRVALRWEAADAADPTAARLDVRNVALLESGVGIEIGSPLVHARFENVLKTGGGELVHLNRGVRAGYRVPMVLKRCTLRESGPLVQIGGTSFQQSGQLSLQGSDTVVAPAEGEPLISIESDTFPPQWARYLEISAQGIVLPRQLQVATFRTPAESSDELPLPSDEMVIDGLLTGKFHFLGSDLSSGEDSVAIVENVPLRLSGTVIGADLRTREPAGKQNVSEGSTGNQFTPAAQIPYNSREPLSPARDQQ